MNNLSLEQIENQIAYHQRKATVYHFLFNARLEKFNFYILEGADLERSNHSAPVKSKEAEIIVKQFLYDLSVFHRNERIKWEQYRDSLSNPDPVIQFVE